MKQSIYAKTNDIKDNVKVEDYFLKRKYMINAMLAWNKPAKINIWGSKILKLLLDLIFLSLLNFSIIVKIGIKDLIRFKIDKSVIRLLFNSSIISL